MGKAQAATRILAAALGASLCGCGSPAARYLARRSADLADCVEATAGVGAPAYARVRATDFAVVACGFAIADRYGWRGRHSGGLAWPGSKLPDELDTELGLPLAWTYEVCTGTAVEEGRRIERPRACRIENTYGPCFTTRRRFLWGRGLSPRTRLAERLGIGAVATLGVSVRVGFQPVEVVDFLAGCLGWDMLQDDETSGEGVDE
jgi:hypothetical protein